MATQLFSSSSKRQSRCVLCEPKKACRLAYRFCNVEPRKDIPGGDEGEQDCDGDLKVGGHIHTHDAHMREFIQGQKEEQQKPEELLCNTMAKLYYKDRGVKLFACFGNNEPQ